MCELRGYTVYKACLFASSVRFTLLFYTRCRQLLTNLVPLNSDYFSPRWRVYLESVMRDIITEIGGYERCVTEFIRVSSTVLPSRVFYRLCPELKTEGRTASGTPVYVQLLGSDPELLAENAKVAVGLGALGIDLNFGCPAKTVNKSRGGATLLKTPDQIGLICQRVRDAVPITVPVTAKIRLGYDSDERFEDIYRSAIGAGIDELTIHARTKTQGYRPPAHWQQIAAVNNVSSIPIIANGELWSPGDIAQCRELSGCEAFMLARGALCRPDLGRSVKVECQGRQQSPMVWPEVLDLFIRFIET